VGILGVTLISALAFLLAYHFYGRTLSRLLRLDAGAKTPSETMRDDVDYVPTPPKYLLGQHFSAIAAAGPIVGPILAGVMFGWLPALLWILVGSVFIGGVHDFTTLVASLRHRARSIAEVVREHMTRRSYLLFLIFVWIALVYIVIAFTDIVAGSFVGTQTLENGTVVSGGGVASSSMLYLLLAVVLGLVLKLTRLSIGWATVIFLPIVGVIIWVGQYIPFDLGSVLDLSESHSRVAWDVVLLSYCFAASLVPVWILLQPRGHLGGYFLIAALAGGMLGIMFGESSIEYPAFTEWVWHSPKGDAMPLFPLLFITVACGACSGFHSLIASGTTSKQIQCETDAKPVGYGSMLLEGMVAVVSLCCVMMLARSDAVNLIGKPNLIYAQGIGRFLEVVGIPVGFGISLGLLAFTTFVYDTLDVCTRLGRYIIQELTNWQSNTGRWVATAITTAVPLLIVTRQVVDASGHPVPAWSVFWPLFGASNQLLAALALIGVTVWLYRTYHARWVWFVTGIPTVLMYVMSSWALVRFVKDGFFPSGGGFVMPAGPVPWVALILVGLAVMLLFEAFSVLRRKGPPVSEPIPVPA
jgi:carbon starvation protein